MTRAFDYAALPDSVQPFVHALRLTERVSLELRLGNEASASPAASRVGGWPYGVALADYPAAVDGKPLVFLAQLNLYDLPELPGYPSTGLLQFFADDGRGQVPPHGAVVYRPTVPEDFVVPDEAPRTRSQRSHPKWGPGQWGLVDETAQHPTTGFLQQMPAPGDSKIGQELFIEAFESPGDSFAVEQAHDDYLEIFESRGHRLGGYANFVQQRPEEDMETVLLFQLDSDPWRPSQSYRVLFGDLGTARFFINPIALIEGDFSEVTFEWDNS